MLESLKNYDADKAAAILASVALSTSPTVEGVGGGIAGEEALLLREDILAEIRRQLRLSEEDDSPSARTKIDEFFSSELGRLALQGKDLKRLRDKAGSIGALRPDLFTVEFTDVFGDCCEPLGMRRSHVEDAVLWPDRVQHFSDEDFESTTAPSASLFLKRIPRKKREDFYVVSMAERKGSTLKVLNAWRVYLSDLPQARYSEPLDYLKGLVHSFGLEFTVGDAWQGKFLFYRDLAVTEQGRLRPVVRVVQNKDDDFVVSYMLRISEDQSRVSLALAFVINVTEYRRALGAHGVRLDA